jgi:hypothetical protein
MIRRELERGDGAIRRVARLVVDQGVPAALTAGLNAAQRFGYLTLLPLNAVIEKEYGNYALLLGAAGAFVTSAAFTREGRRFGIGAFLLSVVASLITVTPFILNRYGVTLGVAPMHFALAATFAYLGFYVTVGILIGGCWSAVVGAFRDRIFTY